MAEIKTKPTGDKVEDFLNKVEGEQKRKDSYAILEMMKKTTKEEPRMWGTSIIGFGTWRYKSAATGREGDWFRVGFSPRKANITIYLGLDVSKHEAALEKLSKHKTGKGCLYFNKLSDVDVKVLQGMIKASL